MNFNPQISNLPIYEAGKPIELVIREFGINPQNIVKLASNENPLGCSPLVLEAMKMDNDITAPCDGVVSFKVVKGANVETDSVLAVIG